MAAAIAGSIRSRGSPPEALLPQNPKSPSTTGLPGLDCYNHSPYPQDIQYQSTGVHGDTHDRPDLVDHSQCLTTARQYSQAPKMDKSKVERLPRHRSKPGRPAVSLGDLPRAMNGSLLTTSMPPSQLPKAKGLGLLGPSLFASRICCS